MKHYHVTVVSKTGYREDSLIDIVPRKPEGHFEQHYKMKLINEMGIVHLHANGVGYSDADAKGMVAAVMGNPIIRATLIKRVLILPLDFPPKFNVYLISEHSNNDHYHLLKCVYTVGSVALWVDPKPDAYKRGYPLDTTLEVMRQWGYAINQIPGGDLSRGWLATYHVKHDWRKLAQTLIEMLSSGGLGGKS